MSLLLENTLLVISLASLILLYVGLIFKKFTTSPIHPAPIHTTARAPIRTTAPNRTTAPIRTTATIRTTAPTYSISQSDTLQFKICKVTDTTNRKKEKLLNIHLRTYNYANNNCIEFYETKRNYDINIQIYSKYRSTPTGPVYDMFIKLIPIKMHSWQETLNCQSEHIGTDIDSIIDCYLRNSQQWLVPIMKVTLHNLNWNNTGECELINYEIMRSEWNKEICISGTDLKDCWSYYDLRLIQCDVIITFT